MPHLIFYFNTEIYVRCGLKSIGSTVNKKTDSKLKGGFYIVYKINISSIKDTYI